MGRKPQKSKAFSKNLVGYPSVWQPEGRSEDLGELTPERTTFELGLPSRGRVQTAGMRLQNILYVLRDALSRSLERDLSPAAVFCWYPVCFCFGVLGYIRMPMEPHVLAFPAIFVVCATSIFLIRRHYYASVGLSFILVICAGIIWVQTTFIMDKTRMLAAPLWDTVQGKIVEIVEGPLRTRLILDDVEGSSFSKLASGKIQLSAANEFVDSVRPGDDVHLRARLNPLSHALYPDGYDFRLAGFANGVAARGFVTDHVIPIMVREEIVSTRIGSGGRQDWSTMGFLRNLRMGISARLQNAMSEHSGSLAMALAVGDRSAINREIADDLRVSGLAHILAISGLHMALVTTIVFSLVRFMGALYPNAALGWPTKKIAALAALGAASFYLLLSGGPVSAQRAFIMASVFLIAVLINRAAMTMRNVAIAATIILLINPAAAVSPGFQMSFIAATALVAVYGRNSPYNNWLTRLRRRKSVLAYVVGWWLGLALTSAVAGFATWPFAAYHFNTVASYGLFGNLLAMPWFVLLVMPAGAVSILLMPFHLEGLALPIMEFGLGRVLNVAQIVSNWPDARLVIGQLPAETTLLLALGILALCLIESRLRFLVSAISLLLAAVLYTGSATQPLLVVSADAKLVAAREHGGFTFLGPGRDLFEADLWARALGLEKPASELLQVGRQDNRCDRVGCRLELTAGDMGPVTIIVLQKIEGFVDSCLNDPVLIVSAIELPGHCPGSASRSQIILDRLDLARAGAIAIFDHVDKSEPASDMLGMRTPLSKLSDIGLHGTPSAVSRSRPWH